MNGFLSMWISFYCYVLQIEVRKYAGGIAGSASTSASARAIASNVSVSVCRSFRIIFTKNINALHITLLRYYSIVEMIWKSFRC